MARSRNPKSVQFSLRLEERINERLDRLADATGQNKGVTTAFVIAAGLNMLEAMMLNDKELEQKQRSAALLSKMQQDATDNAIINAEPVEEEKPRRVGFRSELGEDEAITPTWSLDGYFGGRY